MMQSRGFTAACAALLLAAPSQAWVGQQHRPSLVPTTKAITTTKETPNNLLADMGRQMSTLGFGCALAAATVFGATSPALADAGKFSYDPNLGGPQTWSGLQVEGNQCSGSKQSPIAIKPTGCNIGANYEMQVNNDKKKTMICVLFGLVGLFVCR